MVEILPAVFTIKLAEFKKKRTFIVQKVPGTHWRDQEICIEWSNDGDSKIQCHQFFLRVCILPCLVALLCDAGLSQLVKGPMCILYLWCPVRPSWKSSINVLQPVPGEDSWSDPGGGLTDASSHFVWGSGCARIDSRLGCTYSQSLRWTLFIPPDCDQYSEVSVLPFQ